MAQFSSILRYENLNDAQENDVQHQEENAEILKLSNYSTFAK
jgi:hypothetical protein